MKSLGKLFSCFLLVALATMLQPSLVALAQTDIAEGGRRQTASLSRAISGIEASTVVSYVAISPGDEFDPITIDSSLKTLFATGLFADVAILRRENDLIIAVVEESDHQSRCLRE